MACFIELGHYTSAGFPAVGPEPLSLISAAFPTKISGSCDTMLVTADEPGWLHVSREQEDKASIGRSRRLVAGQSRQFSGINSGMYVSFIADEQEHVFDEPEKEEEAATVDAGSIVFTDSPEASAPPKAPPAGRRGRKAKAKPTAEPHEYVKVSRGDDD